MITSVMRKSLFLLGLLSAAALVSCSIENDLQEPEHARTFRAVLEQLVPDVSTRAYATYDANQKSYAIFWNRGDRVSIFYDKTYNREYQFLERDGSTAGEFGRVGSDPSHFTEQDIETGYDYAIYPYNRDNRCDTQGTLTVVIPEEQTYYDDARGIGARMLMVARDEDGDFTFKHVGSYLGIRLKGEGFSVSSVTLQGNNNEILAGYPLVSYDENDNPVLAFDPNDIDNSKVISMTLETPIELNADEYEVFWLQLPAVSLSNGLTVTVKDPNGRTFEKKINSKITLERRKFYTLSSTVEITSLPVSSVLLDKTELKMNVNETATLVPTVLPAEATDKTVTWETSDSGIATVEDGVVTAVAAGTATITVKTNDGGKTAACAVTVSDVITYSLAITPETAEIDALDTQTYVVTLTTVKNGVASEKVVEAELESGDLGVATVDGLTVTGVEAGTVTITASFRPEGADKDYTAEATLTVKDVISYSLSLTPDTAEINVGSNQDYEAILTTVKNGSSTTKAVNATLTTSDENVATVEGLTATGVNNGTVTITATFRPDGADKDYTAEASLTVKKDTYSLTIDPATDAEVIVGNTKVFTLTLVTTTNGVEATKDVTSEATWTSTDDTIATIAAGTATGVKEGTVTIKAVYTPQGSEKLEISVSLKVNKDPNHAGDPVPIGDDDF